MINNIIFTNGERKKERRNFYGMFSQNLPISTAFIAILEMELPQCNAIGVRTPPGSEPGTAWVQVLCALWLRCIMVVKWNNKSFASCRGRVNISGSSKIAWINVEFNGNSLSVAVPSKVKKCLRACGLLLFLLDKFVVRRQLKRFRKNRNCSLARESIHLAAVSHTADGCVNNIKSAS